MSTCIKLHAPSGASHMENLMGKMMIAWVWLATTLTFASTVSAADAYLADRHAAAGVTCESCHGKGTPSKDVKMQTCLGCHEGSYAKLSEKVDTGDIPFHASHVGDPECTDCHQGHQESRLLCDQCHEFGVKVP